MVACAMSNRIPHLLAFLVVLGAGGFLYAQMGPNDDRVVPYQGTLFQAGDAANGLHDFRFALFTSEPDSAALDCLLSAGPTCPLWAEERVGVNVADGQFSVVLGESVALTDTILGQGALYVGIAVKSADDLAFTKLQGSTRLLPTPWASRAAAANDFRVAGALDVGGNITSDGTLDVTGGVTTAGVVNATTGLATAGTVSAGGDVTAGGRIRANCPANMTRIRPNSATCIDAAVGDVGVYNWYDSGAACQDRGKRMCSVAEVSVAARAGSTATYLLGNVNRWAWADGVWAPNGGLDHGGCHIQLNTDEPATYVGEANCQISAAVLNSVVGTLCCFEQ